MDEYELHGHLSEQLFRAVGGYVANFSSSVSRISEESYSQQAVYLSYTFRPKGFGACHWPVNYHLVIPNEFPIWILTAYLKGKFPISILGKMSLLCTGVRVSAL